MYCRKCGKKLLDDDAFCSKCGAKVINDSPTLPTDNAPVVDVSSESSTEEWLKYPVTRFVLCLLVFVLATILICALTSPPKFSVIEFIKAPEGLARLIGECIGTGLLAFLCFWPLLSGLSMFEVIPKRWKVEAFFLLTFFVEVGSISFGENEFSREVMPLLLFSVLIFGIFLRIIASSSKE